MQSNTQEVSAAKSEKCIIVLGPPRSGKGTQRKRLSEILNIPHVSTGELLRHQVRLQTDLGREVDDLMKRGELVPDELVMEVLQRRLAQSDSSNGFVLDGFPRNRAQSRALDDCLIQMGHDRQSKLIFLLMVSESAIIHRLSGRRTCAACGKTFNVVELASSKASTCDIDGSTLVSRNDDLEHTVRNRLLLFEQTISGILAHYSEQGKVFEIDADGSVDEITRSILSKVSF